MALQAERGGRGAHENPANEIQQALINELMRRNVRVNLFAFSSGCSDSINTAGDSFTSLDDRLFDQANGR